MDIPRVSTSPNHGAQGFKPVYPECEPWCVCVYPRNPLSVGAIRMLRLIGREDIAPRMFRARSLTRYSEVQPGVLAETAKYARDCP